MIRSTEKLARIRTDGVGTLKKLSCKEIKKELEQFVQVNGNRNC